MTVNIDQKFMAYFNIGLHVREIVLKSYLKQPNHLKRNGVVMFLELNDPLQSVNKNNLNVYLFIQVFNVGQ
jgi:hypothetical protein